MSDELPWSAAVRVSYDQTGDAVVVVPGIMGSALYDTVAEQTVWGMRAGWYARAWSRSGPGMTPLAVTEEELAGGSTRVKPAGLLTFPAFSPVFGGFEPYTPLVRAIRKTVRHRSAVLEFAYDWRLSVTHNAGLLADAVTAHVTEWRAASKRSDAQVVLVAHSMGGLLCQALAAISGAMDDVRAVVTLGTPFDGAAKAAVLLGSGDGAPLPRRRLRAVAMTMPGVHDLLPRYRCLDEGVSARRVTPADVAALGGSAALATSAFDAHAARATAVIPRHRAVIGVAQPTFSSLSLRDGVVAVHPYTFEVDGDGELAREHTGLLVRRGGFGDGTVPRSSARPPRGVSSMPLAQQHGALAHSAEATTFVRDVLLHGVADTRDRLGQDAGVGLAVPDVVVPGQEWVATITGIAFQLARCTVSDVDSGVVVDRPRPHRRDGVVCVSVTLPVPGLYRVSVDGGREPVTQLVLAEDP
jgi:pimeloyl-ACP methyl ester carboxylesterase